VVVGAEEEGEFVEDDVVKVVPEEVMVGDDVPEEAADEVVGVVDVVVGVEDDAVRAISCLTKPGTVCFRS